MSVSGGAEYASDIEEQTWVSPAFLVRVDREAAGWLRWSESDGWRAMARA